MFRRSNAMKHFSICVIMLVHRTHLRRSHARHILITDGRKLKRLFWHYIDTKYYVNPSVTYAWIHTYAYSFNVVIWCAVTWGRLRTRHTPPCVSTGSHSVNTWTERWSVVVWIVRTTVIEQFAAVARLESIVCFMTVNKVYISFVRYHFAKR